MKCQEIKYQKHQFSRAFDQNLNQNTSSFHEPQLKISLLKRFQSKSIKIRQNHSTSKIDAMHNNSHKFSFFNTSLITLTNTFIKNLPLFAHTNHLALHKQLFTSVNIINDYQNLEWHDFEIMHLPLKKTEKLRGLWCLLIVSTFLMQSIIIFDSQRNAIKRSCVSTKTPSFLIAIFAEKIRALLFILYASTSVNYYFPFFSLICVCKKGFLLSLIACVHKIFILKKARTWCILSLT